jgi:hypothetical protein
MKPTNALSEPSVRSPELSIDVNRFRIQIPVQLSKSFALISDCRKTQISKYDDKTFSGVSDDLCSAATNM